MTLDLYDFDLIHASSIPVSRLELKEVTFGKLTLGTMTLCRALGASLGGFLGSPPGWYWYLPTINLHQAQHWGSHT